MRFMSACPLLLALAALTGTGCNAIGPGSLRGGRLPYNQAIATTSDEQLLLNLVRLRYRDQPLFLEVSSVSTSYQFSTSAGAGLGWNIGPGAGSSTARAGASLGIGIAEKPTVSYTPLQGDKFARQLLTPVSPDILVVMYHSGWSVERVFRCCVQRMNRVPNAPSASGPTPARPPKFEQFKRISQILRELQMGGKISLAMAAGKDGALGNHLVLLVDDAEKNSDLMQELMRLLGSEPGKTEYVIEPRVLGNGPDSLGMNTRSLMGVLFYLSQGVEVPPKHLEDGLVTRTLTPEGEDFDWKTVTGDLMRIRWTSSAPRNAAVRVYYRGTWFSIDDNDLSSKSSFSMLGQLIALQAGGVKSREAVLTIGVGGDAGVGAAGTVNTTVP